jgi:hypothetical protein
LYTNQLMLHDRYPGSQGICRLRNDVSPEIAPDSWIAVRGYIPHCRAAAFECEQCRVRVTDSPILKYDGGEYLARRHQRDHRRGNERRGGCSHRGHSGRRFGWKASRLSTTNWPEGRFVGELVGAAGFEPTTTSPPDWCATRLRHAPTGGQSSTGLPRGRGRVMSPAYRRPNSIRRSVPASSRWMLSRWKSQIRAAAAIAYAA